MRLYEAIAIAFTAKENCEAAGNSEWRDRWEGRLDYIEYNFLPRGSGFDAGTNIDSADGKQIVLSTSFHHMNEGGFYDGWTEHTIRIKPNLQSRFDMTISGRNRNQIKDYIADVFNAALDSQVTWEQLDGGV